MFAPPPQFNEAQAQSSIQQAQQFGTQKGSKIGSGIGTGLGLLLAPLTGGLSIGLGGSIGGAIGGAIGGGISQKAEQNVVDAQRRAQNRIGMAYQDVTQERNTYDAQSAQRRKNMEMMRQAAFGDLANLYG